jgi:aryl-alcohol dehydrogenase-like predicted oxidoreductase
MEYTQIPGAGFQVSRIALGTWAIGWMWGAPMRRSLFARSMQSWIGALT